MSTLHPSIEGKYEILGKLREGGMGAVYKVRHRLLDEVRVVKVIRPHLGASPELSERFLREAKAAIQLRHPNIAEIHDFSIDEDGGAFLVLEFIAGATLEDLIRGGGPPPLGLALEIARQALQAIGYLHRKGFVHRDIAPDNLMLTRDVEGRPLVKLIDLGIAKVLAGDGDLTVVGMFLGKPRYASPEQLGATAGGKIDGRSDLYSFGAVLYELLTGRLPIAGKDASSLLAGHLFRAPVPFAESDPEGRVPDDLRAIVERALAKRPEDRFASAEEMAASLAAVAARFPLAPGDLERSLRQAATPGTRDARAIPGSTQEELDRRFAPVPTPSPQIRTVRLTPVEAAAAPAASVTLPAAPQAPVPALDLPLAAPRAGAATLPATPAPRPAPLPRRSPLRAALPLLLVLALLAAGIGWREMSAPAPSAVARKVAEVAPPPSIPAAAPQQAPATETATPSTAPQPETPAVAPPLPAPVAPMVPADPAPRAITPPTAPRAADRPVEAPPKPEATLKPKVTPPAEPRTGQKERQVVEVPIGPGRGKADRTDREEPMKRGDPVGSGPGVEDPESLASPAPVYPAALTGSGRTAHVLVDVLIDENGTVTQAKVQAVSVDDGSAGTEFGKAAVEAARKARFKPATRDGIPGKTRGVLTYDFGTPKP